MPKTKPNYRETIFGVLPILEIEALIMDKLFIVRSYIIRNYKNLTISTQLAKDLHLKLAGHLFIEAGQFRAR